MLATTLCFSAYAERAAGEALAINLRETRCEASEPSELRVNASFDFRLPASLEALVKRGIPLHFITEFYLSHPDRHWFFDQQLASATRVTRIIYRPLVQLYGVSTGGLELRVHTLEEALRIVQSVYDWQLTAPGLAEARETHTAAIRLYLDTSRLPKPLQVHAVNAPEWEMDAGWHHFTCDFPSQAHP